MAGRPWQKMLDGRAVLTLLRRPMPSAPRQAIGGRVDLAGARSFDGAVGLADVMPSPFLDVWFADVNEGFLVGAFA